MCRAEDVEPDSDRTLEREASVFAAELLMPAADVRSAKGENRFGVSNEALAWRLYNLGLVNNRPGNVGPGG
jgi:Zn-dependent peptidase ImmA (M78 family)